MASDPMSSLDPRALAALRTARSTLEETCVLDARTSELVSVAALVAVGAHAGSYRVHVRRAVELGVRPEEIHSVLYGIATIVGVPRISEAAAAIDAVLSESGGGGGA